VQAKHAAVQGGPEKCTPNSWPYFCQILTNLQDSFTGRSSSKFAVEGLLWVQPHPAYFATLCTLWISNSRKQIINDTLQGSAAICFRCRGDVSNQIKKGLLLSISEFFFKSVNIWQSYKEEDGCLVHKVRETTTFLLLPLPYIHRFNFFRWQTHE